MPDDAPRPDPTSTSTSAFGTRHDWLDHLARIGRDHGAFNRLGPDHHALFVEEGDTLLVSFDEIGRITEDTRDGMPDGFALVQRREWSLLSVLADGPTWFRDPAIAAFLTALARSGVLSGYRRILMTGLGPMCGHAACAYARLLPGASVLASRPVASLSHRTAPFERRFAEARKGRLDHPFGRGPDGLRHARRAVLLYDPMAVSDAAQIALYRTDNTDWVALPHSGPGLETAVRDAPTLIHLLTAMADGPLPPATVRNILRPALRRDPAYLDRLTQTARAKGHPRRAALLAEIAQNATEDAKLAALISRP